MWASVAKFIIRRRYYLLSLVILATVFMAYHARNAQISHQFLQIIPKHDTLYQEHEAFKETFGEDGNLFVIGFEGDLFSNRQVYNEWYALSRYIEESKGVEEVLSLGGLYNLVKDADTRSIRVVKKPDQVPDDDTDFNALKESLLSLPFYEGLLYNKEANVHLLAVRFDKSMLYSAERIDVIEDIRIRADHFALRNHLDMHYSGLPYIRSVLVTQVGSELEMFIALAIMITALILLIFFRSLYWMVFPLIVIGILILFVIGTFGLTGYQITLLSALIPPLITIICVPNFIYFLNKYHIEFRKHGNKMRAIARVIRKIGAITFMTNFSTAIGFGVLAVTRSPALQEFGIVAFSNIIATYVVTMILIPVVFSLLPSPSARQTHYLEGKLLNRVIDRIRDTVLSKRKWVYMASLLILGIAIAGLTRLEAVGYIMDDIPDEAEAYQDLMFFEEHFDGVMPLEVVVDAGRKEALTDLSVLRNMRAFQDTLEARPEISKSTSPADLLMFARQAYFNGDVHRYGMPSQREMSFIEPYIANMDTQAMTGIMSSLANEEMQLARISAQVRDIGSVKMSRLIDDLTGISAQIFPETFNITFTGTSLVFVKGNDYLVRNLLQSLTLAFIIIAILMGFLFGRVRMIFISLVPNFLPLLLTAGLMGYAGIPLKPSTILVFSIAFGISIDDALHFLGKYRQELKNFSGNVADTITFTLQETGKSMIYTSLVLFFGFSIFYFSDFGGTQAIGLLTSITLLVAMVTNLVLLPSLLMTFTRSQDDLGGEKSNTGPDQ